MRFFYLTVDQTEVQEVLSNT